MIDEDQTCRLSSRRRVLAAGASLPVVVGLARIGATQAQPKPPVLVGRLGAGSPSRVAPEHHPFHQGMAALGWKLGTHYVVEERYAEGRIERLPALAQELAARKPAVIVASPSAAARAAAAAAPATPIVLMGGDALAFGLVTSLARPGGMITGLSTVAIDTGQKVVELLVESFPKLQRVGFLADSTIPPHAAVVSHARRAAERARIEAVIVDVAKPEDIEPALGRLAKERVQALVLLASTWFGGQIPSIVAPALARRWPVVGNLETIARQGGLFAFYTDGAAIARRAAYYVDRILKGAKPGDLPIEQPTTFELLLNRKTAKALGLTIPAAFMARVTEVIE